MSRRTPVILLLLVLVVGTVVVGVRTATAPSAGSAAESLLRSDATGAVRIDHATDGRLRFVGAAPSGGPVTAVVNPSVAPGDSVVRAAREHLARYGAALGAAGGTEFVAPRAARTAVGGQTVRFTQQVSGIPVLGGEVLVGLDPKQRLTSLTSEVAPVVPVVGTSLDPDRLDRVALALVGRRHPDADLTVQDQGRWILDPELVGLDLPSGVGTVRRIEVGDGDGDGTWCWSTTAPAGWSSPPA